MMDDQRNGFSRPLRLAGSSAARQLPLNSARVPRLFGDKEFPASGTSRKRSRYRVQWQRTKTYEEELKIVQRVFSPSQHNGPRSVVFSAIEEGAGCSHVCTRAAVTLADEVEGSVCIVDGNVQNPSLHDYFGLDNTTGLLNAVFDFTPVKDCARPCFKENLRVLTNGTAPHNINATVTEERLESVMKELSETFDYVLIDIPPFKPYTYSTCLGQLADGVVLVLESQATHRDSARELKELAKATGLHVLGAVLNKRPFSTPDWIYRRLFGRFAT